VVPLRETKGGGRNFGVANPPTSLSKAGVVFFVSIHTGIGTNIEKAIEGRVAEGTRR
jgi:hypothetical protein